MTPLEIGVAVVKALAAIIPEIAKAISGMSDEDIAKLIASAKSSIPGSIDTSGDAAIRARLVDPGGAPQPTLSVPPPNPFASIDRVVRKRIVTPTSFIAATAEIVTAVNKLRDAIYEAEAEGTEEP